MTTDQYTNNWLEARADAEERGLRIVEIGWEQHVIIDEPRGLVYRYPRNAAAAAKLDDEVAVLHDIHQRDWPVELPIMCEHTPKYTAYTYIPGEVLTPDRTDHMDQAAFDRIGEALGSFLVEFHALDHSIIDQKQTRHTTTLLQYYTDRIEGAKRTEFYPRAYDVLMRLSHHPAQAPQVVVHGDLHGPNIVVDPAANRLQGVIDLSEMEVGEPHQELRKIFMTVPGALRATMDSYARSGGIELSEEKIILWAFVNEWANVCYFADDPENVTYQRAIGHLRHWQQL